MMFAQNGPMPVRGCKLPLTSESEIVLCSHRAIITPAGLCNRCRLIDRRTLSDRHARDNKAIWFSAVSAQSQYCVGHIDRCIETHVTSARRSPRPRQFCGSQLPESVGYTVACNKLFLSAPVRPTGGAFARHDLPSVTSIYESNCTLWKMVWLPHSEKRAQCASLAAGLL